MLSENDFILVNDRQIAILCVHNLRQYILSLAFIVANIGMGYTLVQLDLLPTYAILLVDPV